MTTQKLLQTLTTLFVISLASISNAYEPTPRIIGGSEVAVAYPWMVSIQYQPQVFSNFVEIYPFCGGTLIDKRWVLTAAHCMFDAESSPASRIDADDLLVIIGARNILNIDGDGHNVEGDSIEVEEIHIYPGYKYSNFSVNDIALLKLASRSNLSRAPLAKKSEVSSLVEGEPMLALGWGATNPSGTIFPDILNSVYIPLRSTEQCAEVIEDFDEDLLCAGSPAGGLDSCVGDSGGPLMAEIDGTLKLAGVVSFGLSENCGEAGAYGGYTNVASYRSWINSVQNDEEDSKDSGGAFSHLFLLALLILPFRRGLIRQQ
ncbi:MAG: serine protease [Pseudomonadales bacterium]|nr:serine protease [Pseudomonadales bacterium]